MYNKGMEWCCSTLHPSQSAPVNTTLYEIICKNSIQKVISQNCFFSYSNYNDIDYSNKYFKYIFI